MGGGYFWWDHGYGLAAVGVQLQELGVFVARGSKGVNHRLRVLARPPRAALLTEIGQRDHLN